MRADRSSVTQGVRLGLGAVALAGALAAALAAGAVEEAGAAKAKTIGQTKDTPEPSCPKTPCEAVGNVTGFQTSAGGEKGIFKIRADGHLVAWSVDTSRPNAEQREFFGDFYRDPGFGRSPVARVAILRKEEGTKFELRKQSPPVTLSQDLGTMPLITLDRPLKVKQGDVLALTIPTWLSSFAVDLTNRDVWRASRLPDKCGREDIPDGKPQEKVGSVRRYGCRYSTARLLYWGYFVPERGGEGGGGDGSDGGGDGGGGDGGGGRKG